MVKVPGVNHLLVPAKTGEVDEYGALPDKKISAQRWPRSPAAEGRAREEPRNGVRSASVADPPDGSPDAAGSDSGPDVPPACRAR